MQSERFGTSLHEFREAWKKIGGSFWAIIAMHGPTAESIQIPGPPHSWKPHADCPKHGKQVGGLAAPSCSARGTAKSMDYLDPPSGVKIKRQNSQRKQLLM